MSRADSPGSQNGGLQILGKNNIRTPHVKFDLAARSMKWMNAQGLFPD
jgi:hypothetical protein